MPGIEQPSGLMDIASSLTQDEIPFKLRCAICNKLAWNAFRLPCCDQAICENCQTSLPSSCPVCAHSPLDASLCKPNKALRITLKAFLRTEEKKREKERPTPTPTKQSPPPEVVANDKPEQVPEPTAPETPLEEGTSTAPDVLATSDQTHHTASDDKVVNNAPEVTAVPNVPNTEMETPQNEDQQNEQDEPSTVAPRNGSINEADTSVPPETPSQPSAEMNSIQNTTSGAASFVQPDPGFANGMSLNANDPSRYGQMGWQGPGEYNQPMQFMANGMQPGGMPPFQGPMGGPGMPGMGMEQMAAAQGMFADYGMNMNGMNDMSMGMNYGAGQGMYGTWDGQNNMWNGGPDNFNGIAFPNRMGADFGPNPGFRGYNMSQPHGNYPHMHQQQKYPRNEFQGSFGPYGRGSGRGRGFTPGGRGRGGYNSNMQGNYPSTNSGNFQRYNSSHFNQQHPQHQYQNNVSAVGMPGSQSHEEITQKFSDELCPGGEDELREHQPKDELADATNEKPTVDQQGGSIEVPLDKTNVSHGEVSNVSTTAPGNAVDVSVLAAKEDVFPIPSYTSTADLDGAHGRFQTTNGVQPILNGASNTPMPQTSVQSHNPMFMNGAKAPGVVGAPAAPRAMRQGLPNIGIRNNRGFAGPPVGRNTPNQQVKESRSAPSDEPDNESRAELKSKSKSRSRSRSRSPSGHRSRRHRHRSRSRSPDSGSEDERRRHRRSRRSRREENTKESSYRDSRRGISRSKSPVIESSSKSSHRSRRDKDRTNGDKSSSSRRTHRRRSRSSSRKEPRRADVVEKGDTGLAIKGSSTVNDGENAKARTGEKRDSASARGVRTSDRGERHRHRDRDRDREVDRDRDRERDRGRDRKRSRRDRSESRGESEKAERRARRARREEPSSQVNGSREATSKDHTRSTGSSKKDITSDKDPHTLEREARNRERLLKERQRREAVNADRDGKSSRRRDGKSDRNLLGRRVSYKYEDEVGDPDRAARIEHEREAARWA